MKISIHFKVLVALVSINLNINQAIGEEDKAAIQEITKETKNQSQELKINIKSLDELWDKRQSKEGEQEIIQFLLKDFELPRNFDVCWRIGRLVYYAGNFSYQKNTHREEKMKLFKLGYSAAEIARELEPKRVEGHFWYAINLGSYGLEKGIFSALNNAKPGRDALLEASKIDPTYHWCGPLRILGRYYQDVPGGIISFGDKQIAQDYFEKAVQTCPEFRLNTIYLGILKQKMGEKSEALELFKKAQTLPGLDGRNEEKRYAKELAENIKNVQNM